MDRRPPVTLADVARHAHVSLATASRVLNGNLRTVGEPFRARVLAAASELHYSPNAHAQAVARGASNVVGLVVHDIADPYFSMIAAGVMRRAEERGMVVLLASTRRDAERELEYVAMLRSQRARAVIIAGSRSTDRAQHERLVAELEGYAAAGGQIACISQNRLGTHTVLPLNRAGAKELGGRLAGLGHHRFALLAGGRDLATARDRLRGFREGLAASGVALDDVQVEHGPFTRDGGYEVAERLVAQGLRATCVFAVNDVMAVGAMAALRDAGVRVPEDVSVAGFDDIATLRDLVPSLTTVRLPLHDMGTQAADMALATETRDTPRVVRVRGEVVLRDSTRRLT